MCVHYIFSYIFHSFQSCSHLILSGRVVRAPEYRNRASSRRRDQPDHASQDDPRESLLELVPRQRGIYSRLERWPTRGDRRSSGSFGPPLCPRIHLHVKSSSCRHRKKWTMSNLLASKLDSKQCMIIEAGGRRPFLTLSGSSSSVRSSCRSPRAAGDGGRGVT